MATSDPAPVIGGIAFALCPLLCIGVPVLVTAGIGSGLALAIGGAVIGGVGARGAGRQHARRSLATAGRSLLRASRGANAALVRQRPPREGVTR